MISDRKGQVSGYISKTPAAAPTKHDITRSVLFNSCMNQRGRASLRDMCIARFASSKRSHRFQLFSMSRTAAAFEREGGYIPGRGQLTSTPPSLACACLSSCPAITQASSQSNGRSVCGETRSACDCSLQVPLEQSNKKVPRKSPEHRPAPIT